MRALFLSPCFSSLLSPCRPTLTLNKTPTSNASSSHLLSLVRAETCLYGSPVCATGRKVASIEEKREKEYEEEEEDEEEEGEWVPFGEMRKWMRNKPSGFGQGKNYDTSLEDRLLGEMEQSRQAQLANIENLKRNPIPPPGKETQLQHSEKKQEIIQGSVQVRVGNLPKKKNIHRDLQSAFKGFPGLLHISPAVSGNKKTRDPVCKGFAVLDLQSEEAAKRFVEKHSGQIINFGKVQKQISCDITNPMHYETADGDSGNFSPCLPVLHTGTNNTAQDSNNILSSMEEQEGTYADESDAMEPNGSTSNGAKDLEDTSPSKALHVKNCEPDDKGIKLLSSSLASKQVQKRQVQQKKKQQVKKKPEGLQKQRLVLGSANRLKIKERVVLTEVFSKYAASIVSTEGPQES
ncbi:hypothetical protein AMTRI_Chr10g5800 [Amborella trichopoda]|uniref:RRM domain-containing protein n=1 Tax=Amborella trichopoda TaxID=13333 RepID=W1NY13_AMBTC|nr:uncharacterized protein LOC18427619 [Amborella trichopoda]ERM99584.1 hypothetical protein AMTR_s00088p00132770 [Amborella trichopoda]|eukprot:XP_006836731.1 uncharacterized protein LOC18427619 [Amborella trichopoda]